MAALWPIRRSFELAIGLKGGLWRKSSVVIRYEEASVKEVLEFDPKDPGEWAYRFVMERARPLRAWECAALWARRHSLFESVVKTRFAFLDGKEARGGGEWSPFASVIAWLSKEANVAPHVLLSEYTFPQFQALAEGVAWNANATTKEGRARNAALASRKRAERTPQEELAIREALSKLEGRHVTPR
jgi:hypothetical protein